MKIIPVKIPVLYWREVKTLSDVPIEGIVKTDGNKIYILENLP